MQLIRRSDSCNCRAPTGQPEVDTDASPHSAESAEWSVEGSRGGTPKKDKVPGHQDDK